MTDHTDPPGHDDLDAPSAEEALTDAQLAELVDRLVGVDPPTVSKRTAHIAAALDAFDELPVSPGAPPAIESPNVVKITARTRRRRATVQRLTIAAALLLVAGLGVFLVGRGSMGSSEDTSSADRGVVSSDAGNGGADLDAAAPESAAADSTAPQYGPAEGEAVAPSAAPVPSPVIPQLGEVPDDDALRVALDVARRRQESDASKSTPESTFDDVAGGLDGATTTAPAPLFGRAQCLAAIPPGGVPVADATVNGRPVIVVDVPGTGGSTTIVIDLGDCSTRTL